jgi:hypothetical protein
VRDFCRHTDDEQHEGDASDKFFDHDVSSIAPHRATHHRSAYSSLVNDDVMRALVSPGPELFHLDPVNGPATHATFTGNLIDAAIAIG